jgi:hypothetical protein
MKRVQDDFFSKTGDRFGLLRYGPRRNRLSREEIINRDHEKRLKQKRAVAAAEQEEKIRETEAILKKTEQELAKIRTKKGKMEDVLSSKEKSLKIREKAITEREEALAAGEQKQAGFEKGLRTSLKGWKLPEPKAGEFASHYVKRIAGDVMGIVQRALNTVLEYAKRQKALEKEKAEMEAARKAERERLATRAAVLEKAYTEKVKGLKAAYEIMKRKILGIRTMRELEGLQKQMSREESEPVRSRF